MRGRSLCIKHLIYQLKVNFKMLFVQETAKSRAELLVKTLDDKDQGKMPVMLIYGET